MIVWKNTAVYQVFQLVTFLILLFGVHYSLNVSTLYSKSLMHQHIVLPRVGIAGQRRVLYFRGAAWLGSYRGTSYLVSKAHPRGSGGMPPQENLIL